MELHADIFKGKGELSTKFVLRKIGAELIEFLFHVGKVEKKRKKKQDFPTGPSQNTLIFSFSYAFFSFLRCFSCDSSENLVYSHFVLLILLFRK